MSSVEQALAEAPLDRPNGHDDPFVERTLLLEAQRLARLGSWSAEVDTGRIYLSEGLRQLCDLDEVGTIAEALELVHGDDLIALQELRDALRSNGSSRPVELEIRDSTGTRTFLVRARSERGVDGRVIRLHGTVQDVTQYRAAEKQASQDRRLFGDAQRVARLGTWEWNSETDECIWSSMLYELLGVEPGTPVSHADYLGLVHPDDRGWVDQRCQELVTHGRPLDVEHRVIRPDGARRVFRCRGEAQVRTGNGL
jgi:PAS domain-containing protein